MRTDVLPSSSVVRLAFTFFPLGGSVGFTGLDFAFRGLDFASSITATTALDPVSSFRRFRTFGFAGSDFANGELDLATSEEFMRPAQEAITGRRPLIVDLTACSFLDSSGLRAILQVYAALQDGNEPAVPMAAVVIGDSPAGRLLSLTEVDKRLSVFATREEAGEWLASKWKANGRLGTSSKTSTA